MAERILVVDDDPAIRDALATSLGQAGFAVDLAGDGREALAALRDDPPDLVVLDVMMPGIDGFEVVRRLRLADPDLPVIMLTARDAVDDRIEGLETGADDYLVKPFAVGELLARIRVRLRRRAAAASSALAFADLRLDPATREALRGERAIALTTTEFDLLHFLVQHPREALSRERIFQAVWGYPYDGESKAIDVYVGYLRDKLEAAGEPRLIKTIRGIGYALREDA